jgi:O-antigen/teichoic acid export membrane protein
LERISPLTREFSIDLIWNFGSLLVLGACGIVINTVIARLVGPAALGVFNQVFALYIFLSQLSVGGVHFSVLKYVSHDQDNIPSCAVISGSGLLLSLILAAPVAFLTFFGRGAAGELLNSPGVVVGLGLAAPGLVPCALNKVLLNVLNGVSRMRAYAVFQALRFIAILTAVVALSLLPVPDAYLAASLTIAEAMIFIPLVAYVHLTLLPLHLRDATWGWMRKHFYFGVRGFFSGALTEVNTRIDVLTLGYFATDRTVGIYSFAAILAEGFSQLALVVRRNVDPLLGQSFAKVDLRKIERHAKKIRRVFSPVMLAVGVGSVMLYPIGVKLAIDDPAFYTSTGVFAILMVGVVLNAGYRPFLGILLQGGRPATHTLLVLVLVLVNLFGNILLIPRLAMYGAAASTAIVYILEAYLIIVFSRRLFGIRL